MFRHLQNLLQQLASGSRRVARSAPTRKPQRRPNLCVEALEDRLVLSATPVFQFLNVPASVQAGASFSFTVEELSNNKVVSSGGAASASLSLAFNGNSSPLETISLSHGVGQATLKLTTAETADFVATSGNVTGSQSITVTPGPLTHFALSTPSQETVGAFFAVFVKAEDANNNVVSSDNQAPTFTASYGHPVSVLIFNWSDGVGTATVTLDTAGTTTITASAGKVTGTSGSITVDGAVQFGVYTDDTATVGTPFKVLINAEDVNGFTVPTFNQTPSITASDGQPVAMSSITWSDGIGTATITLGTSGTTTLTATAGKVTGTSNSITVAPVTNATWSGYVLDPGFGVTAVGGSWTQPAVTGANGALESTWVGIDGDGDSTVEQCGTTAYIGANGQPGYYAWYEFYGDQAPSSQSPNPNPKGPAYYPVTLPNFAVHPGDKISAEVSLVAGNARSFLFQMTDQPASGGARETFSSVETMQYVTPARTSAEWIVENPNYGQQPLANFGQVSFTGAWAEIQPTALPQPSAAIGASVIIGPGIPGALVSTVGPVSSFADFQQWNMVSNEGSDSTSNLVNSNTLGFNEPKSGASSSGFTVTYDSEGNSSAGGLFKTGSALGSTVAVDSVSAPDALVKHLGTTAAEEALFSLSAQGNKRQHERLL